MPTLPSQWWESGKVRLSGTPNLSMVVDGMRKFAIKDRDNLIIRRQVELICKDVEQGDYASEALAIYYWVCANIRYMRDPNGTEFVKDPIRILQTGSGDCDDLAVILACMLMACGNKVSFVLVSFNGGPPTHVYLQVETPQGPVPLDPVANRDTAAMLRRVKSRSVVPVNP